VIHSDGYRFPVSDFFARMNYTYKGMNKGVGSSMGVLMLIILWFNFKEEFVFGLSLQVHPTLILLLFSIPAPRHIYGPGRAGFVSGLYYITRD